MVRGRCCILHILRTLEQGLRLVSIAQLEVIQVLLGLLEAGAKAVDYTGYIISINDIQSARKPPRPWKNLAGWKL